MSLHELLVECARLASGAGAGALASVAKRHGSLPMGATAKMLVTAGGARIGTVGGGCLEGEIIERSHDVIQSRAPALSSHTLNAELAGDYGLTCGGTVEMFVEPVYLDERLAAVYSAAAAMVAAGRRGVMATGIDWSESISKAVRSTAYGDVKRDVGHRTSAGDSRLFVAMDGYDSAREAPWLRDGILVEAIVGKPRLVVFGGGHVGARVAEVAALAGWRVTVVDDRADFADPRRLPFAERAITCDFHDVASAVALDADSYVVIATRGHQHDVVLAGQLVPRPLRYLGMLGSRRKVALTAKALRAWGLADDDIARVHAPVGIAIGADTPEEIAVSVVAEMIAVRRAGSRRRGGTDAGSARRSAQTSSGFFSNQER